jgi:hypothetical protein
MYKITISQFTADASVEVYAQSVESLSLKTVIDAINNAPEPVKQRRVRKDKGIPHKPAQATAGLQGK